MSLDPGGHCPDCDGFVSVPSFYRGSRRCCCGTDRKPIGSFAKWYLDEHPELAAKVAALESTTTEGTPNVDRPSDA